jgi:hypothetical protein
MKHIILSLLLLLSITFTTKADLFAIKTNQPALGTNILSQVIASNLIVFRTVLYSNVLVTITNATVGIDGATRFTGTTTFDSTNVFNLGNIFNDTNTFNGSNTFNNKNFFNAASYINVTNLVIPEGLNMSFTYTNMFLTNGTFAGRTNTLYFTNGILVRLTTP